MCRGCGLSWFEFVREEDIPKHKVRLGLFCELKPENFPGFVAGDNKLLEEASGHVRGNKAVFTVESQGLSMGMYCISGFGGALRFFFPAAIESLNLECRDIRLLLLFNHLYIVALMKD